MILFAHGAGGQERGQRATLQGHLLHMVSAGAQGLLGSPRWLPSCSWLVMLVTGWEFRMRLCCSHMTLSKWRLKLFTAWWQASKKDQFRKEESEHFKWLQARP